MATVLVVGSTGHIGIAAIIGALRSGHNVLAVVRNQESAKKLKKHVPEGHERITTVEADVVSDKGVESVVEKVRAGALPAFQHVFSSVGGAYTDQSMLDTTAEELRQFMRDNFESNFSAYRATVPYLLEQNNKNSTWTVCTGAQGDMGLRALPAISQGALYSMSYSACHALKNTNVRFNEIYLACRVEVDAEAAPYAMKSSVFSRTYGNILVTEDIKSSRIRVKTEEDVDNLKVQRQ